MGHRAPPVALGLVIVLLAVPASLGGDLTSAQAAASAAQAAAADPGRTSKNVLLLFEAAEVEFEALTVKSPPPTNLTDIRWEWAMLLRAKGMFISQSIQNKSELHPQFAPAGIKAMKGADIQFAAVAKALDRTLRGMPATERSGDVGKALAWKTGRARFYLCAGSYQQGLLLDEGDTARENQLRMAAAKFSEFLWENEDNILGGYATLYLGFSEKELGHPRKAIAHLLSVATGYPVPDQADEEKYREWSKLFLQGYYKLAEYCNKLGVHDGKDYRKVALSILQMMPKRIPDLWQRQFGHLAVIEQAQALMGLGSFKAAKALLKRVVKESKSLPTDASWGHSTAHLASQLLLQITAAADLPATAEDLFRAATVKKAAHKWAEADTLFLAAATACATEEEIRAHAIPAWMEIGECRYRDERFREAYEAYDHLLQNFESLDADLAGNAAYYRYRCAAALFAKTRHANHEALKRAARRNFAESYPDHPRANDLCYYLGADLIAQVEALLAKGEREQALAAHARAVEYLTTVKPSSILYAKARARIVEIHCRTDAHDEALRAMAELLAYLADPANRTTNSKRLANREAAGALATYYGARSLENLRRWQEMLDLLADYEEKYASQELSNFRDGVKEARARARQLLDLSREEEDGPSDD